MMETTNAFITKINEKNKLMHAFKVKGITLAVLSGIAYGLYTAFMTQGMSVGVWEKWYGGAVSAFVTTYTLSAIGSACNDLCSAIWALIIAAIKGKLGDFFRCLKSKPGIIMMFAAIVGGPIASTAYVLSIQTAGSIAIPITALCPAVGALLGRILFKQKLTGKMLTGVFICVGAAILIGSTSFSSELPKTALFGCIIAFIAALGWGAEGAIAGYGTALIDYEIGITIRQCTSGLTNLIILIPLFCIINGDNISYGYELVYQVFSNSSIVFFIISGFFAVYAFSLWYKGNSMCGAALGMACNGMYSFWGPFFCFILIGLIFHTDGYAIPWQGWLGAIIMIAGIFVIAINQNAAEKETDKTIIVDENSTDNQQTLSAINDVPISKYINTLFLPQNMKTLLPLNYAILVCFTSGEELCADNIIKILESNYASFKTFCHKEIINALLTAEKNGFITEGNCKIIENNQLQIYYYATTEQIQTINSYIQIA